MRRKFRLRFREREREREKVRERDRDRDRDSERGVRDEVRFFDFDLDFVLFCLFLSSTWASRLSR